MKRLENPVLALALGILTACSGPQSTLRTETQTEPVTLEQEAGENGLCHVHYKHADLKARCTEIVALMRSELRIPAHAHLVLRPSTASYEEIRRLVQSLQGSGYKLGYVNSR